MEHLEIFLKNNKNKHKNNKIDYKIFKAKKDKNTTQEFILFYSYQSLFMDSFNFPIEFTFQRWHREPSDFFN